MGPFAGTNENKKYILVAIDHFSAYPIPKFVKSTKIKGVENFLRKYICGKRISQIIRTVQASDLMRNKFKAFREEFGLRQITCPVYDHRGNGKVERLIRTTNERLRANPELLAERQNKLFFQLVSALRVNKGKDGKLLFERHVSRKQGNRNSPFKEKGSSRKDPKGKEESKTSCSKTSQTLCPERNHQKQGLKATSVR